MDAVSALAPNPPMEMEWATFREVLEAFAVERLERQHRGGVSEQAYAARARAGRERNEQRHQFLAAWPSPAGLIDPLALGLGSWAFNGGRGLPPYVHRTADHDLTLRLKAPGITTVTGAPKSGKSRSILETLRREHPDAITWWVNPSPSVLPLVVKEAKKTPDEKEKPTFIVLDDAGLIGTDPAAGLTAQRLYDLAAACIHLVVVVHDETLAAWEHQLTHRTPGAFDTHSVGATRELMDLLKHRIRYDSVLDDDETVPASEAYDQASPRIKSFDLTRLAETLSGVQTLLAKARKMLSTPASVEAVLLEAAIDASLAFPTGAPSFILIALAKGHYQQRQPNRPWRPQLLDDAFDALTTGITVGSPHAILTSTDHETYRLMDALTHELQRPERDPLRAIGNTILPQILFAEALVNTGKWHFRNDRTLDAKQLWTHAANNGNSAAMFLLGSIAAKAGEAETAAVWWERAANAGNHNAMYFMGRLADRGRDAGAAQTWWERAANAGHTGAMYDLGVRAKKSKYLESARYWWERAANAGHSEAMYNLGRLANGRSDVEAARTWWERAANAGSAQAMYHLGGLAKKSGDITAARVWWKRAADSNHADAMYVLGRNANQTGDEEAARVWFELAAEQGLVDAMESLAELAANRCDPSEEQRWRERRVEVDQELERRRTRHKARIDAFLANFDRASPPAPS